jgi:hypothetical protein
MGRKKALEVRLGTCVRLYEDGGLDPAALPGAFFDVVAVLGRDGGSPGSPGGPVRPNGWVLSSPPLSDSVSDMVDEMTLMGPPLFSGTANPVGKDERSLLLVMIARSLLERCAWCIWSRDLAWSFVKYYSVLYSRSSRRKEVRDYEATRDSDRFPSFVK